MVRNIAGVLMAIGAGEQPLGWAQQVLAQRDRTQAGVTASADGLYLLAVRYPERFGLPALTEMVPGFGDGGLGC
jgi:tRNA pseudouridine38-40 synthase